MKRKLVVLFVLSLLLSVCVCASSCNKKNDNSDADFLWEDIILADIIPEPPSNEGEINENSMEELWMDVESISEKQFSEYVTGCKDKGFTVDIILDSGYFEAYNAEGYKLELDYYSSDSEMDIELTAPIQMGIISWPSSEAGSKLPTPKSSIGKIYYEYDDEFYIYIGDTTKADYIEYVNTCSEKGFNVDYDKGDNYYDAYNAEGWWLSITYEGNNIMSVDIEAPDEEDDENEIVESEDTTKYIPETNEATTDTQIDETDAPVDDGSIDPDFKAAMDSYENFMNEYVDFMKKYSDNPSDLNLLKDYATYMSKYAQFVKDFEKWEDEDLNGTETAYYIDVQTRVNQKLLEIAY